MIKFLFQILMLFSFCSIHSQQDSIVNYITTKGKIVSKDKAVFYEVLVKKDDSLWLVERYLNKLNLIAQKAYYTTKTKNLQIGKQTRYSRFGKIIGERQYDKKGKKIGKNITWFDNANVNWEGSYVDGKQEGEWNFYHYNGKLALQKFYHEGELISKIYFDEKEIELPRNGVVVDKEDRVFKGGKKKYFEKIQQLKKEIKFDIKATITVRYLIGVDGRIYDVTIDEFLPKQLKSTIIDFFENLKGWKPRIHNNRKIPSLYAQRINFKS